MVSTHDNFQLANYYHFNKSFNMWKKLPFFAGRGEGILNKYSGKDVIMLVTDRRTKSDAFCK